jgi:hypothetical protein
MKHALASLALAAGLLGAAPANADPGLILGNINKDKFAHVVGVAAVVAAGTAITGDERYGLAAGVAVSAVREVYKWQHPGYHASAFSIGSDALGLYVGHKVVKGLGIAQGERGGLVVTYNTEF